MDWITFKVLHFCFQYILSGDFTFEFKWLDFILISKGDQPLWNFADIKKFFIFGADNK